MKKILYPKTPRLGFSNKAVVTEKLDGSNLGIFRLGGELIIAQRNNVYKLSEVDKNIAYKGLIGWLNDNAHTIDLHEGSGVFGEWIGMGQIGYGDHLDKKFYIFAKANIDEDFEIKNINYTHSLFIYPFIQQVIPECMGIVPVIGEYDFISVDMLDEIYDEYIKQVDRKCEGFVCCQGGAVNKYVRYKDGTPSKHKG